MTPPPNPLITVDELAARVVDSEPLHVLDVRWVLGGESQHDAYLAGHIPGARWVEFEESLTGTPGNGGRHPMPSVELFTEKMRQAGVDNDVSVVVYDAGNSLAAARLWWLLRYFGKSDVQVLDGGFAAWQREGREVESGQPEGQGSGDFTASKGDAKLIDAEVAGEMPTYGVLIDARPVDRFRGENETIDPVAGHIPGAVSLPALSNLDEDGRFLPTDVLRQRLAALGVNSDARVGTYCGSGVQASHMALAIAASEIGVEPEVYIGSWSHWITDSERPVEVGPATSA